MKRYPTLTVISVCLFACGAMLLVDGIWQPGYALKSLVKALLFLGLPLLVSRRIGRPAIRPLFRLKKGQLLPALLPGIALYALLVGGYFLLRPLVDFSRIAGQLSATAGVTRENFLFVSLYISFVNSLLEEFFFRGFVYRGLAGTVHPAVAYGVSAVSFSLYHTAMMAGWFPLPLFLLALVGLAAGGVLFILLNRQQKNLYPSWLVHMFANFGINTIGFLLL